MTETPQPAPLPATPAPAEGRTDGPEVTEPGAAQHEAPQHGSARRGRRGIVLGTTAAVLLVGGGATAAVLASREPTAPVTPPAVTITNPVPTPAVAPVPREASTALVALLPDTVLQWAFAGIAPDESVAGALEGYRASYTDGAGGTVVVQLAQLRDPAAAGTVAAGLASTYAAATPTGADLVLPVVVAGAQAGEATIRRVDGADGAATWVNGTVALQATGPAAAIERFFRAFPV